MEDLKRLTKSKDKMVGGVLAGFARYFEIDPVWLRVGYVLFAIFGNAGIAVVSYIIALIIMPYDSLEDVNINVSDKRKSNGNINVIIGITLIILGLIFLTDQLYKIDVWQYLYDFYHTIKYYIWSILFIGVGFLVIFKGKKKN